MDGFKPFVFSQIKGEYLLDRTTKLISFSSSFSFRFASDDQSSIGYLMSNLVNRKEYKLNNQIILLEKVVPIPEKEISDGKHIIRTLSPITIHRQIIEEGKGKTLYLAPGTKDFVAAINHNLFHKIDKSDCMIEKEEIRIEPCQNMKKVNILYKNFTIIAYQGEFILEGKKEIIHFLLDHGIGDRNSQGFGMFEVKK